MESKVSRDVAALLREYAERYETADFIVGDPSWFMHQVSSEADREVMAFLAAGLSYGSRAQFLPKIQSLLDLAEGKVDAWVREGAYRDCFHAGDPACFYRLYTRGDMFCFLELLRALLGRYGSLGGYLREVLVADGALPQGRKASALAAVEALCRHFGTSAVVPKDASSACKRLCMFLRWMVRDSSPVDLGLWTDFIDKRSLIVPLDTHVLTEASALGLIHSRNASMSSALRLTSTLATIFPDDPLKGDFALFGYGVNH